VEARDGVLDLVDDRLVVSGGSGTVGHARGLVVDGLAGGLVLIGLEVSVMDVRSVMMMKEMRDEPGDVVGGASGVLLGDIERALGGLRSDLLLDLKVCQCRA
jgi:hypothetical protein